MLLSPFRVHWELNDELMITYKKGKINGAEKSTQIEGMLHERKNKKRVY